jgi:predicted membrane-bound spermidine synthase
MERVRRAFPYAVVFITSMSIMIIELVASRLVAKYFGNSLFTWTGIIGTVLGGIGLGNYLGGRLADLRARNGKGYLTDDHAPVENLMAPVFLDTIE